MPSSTQIASHPVELATRHADGMVVSLHWQPRTNGLHVVVLDSREGDVLKVPVREGQSAIDVFRHPYAYAEAAAAA